MATKDKVVRVFTIKIKQLEPSLKGMPYAR